MSDVAEARKTYGDVVAKIKRAEVEYQSLTQRLDDMEAETSVLKSKVESCEDEEKNICDAYFLGKSTEKDLSEIQRKVKNAKEGLTSHSKMLESLNRCIIVKDREINMLRKQVDSLRHQVWNSLFEQRAAEIPDNIKATVRELICVGLNSNRGMHFILPEIFSLPTNTEIQQIYQRIATELNIE